MDGGSTAPLIVTHWSTHFLDTCLTNNGICSEFFQCHRFISLLTHTCILTNHSIENLKTFIFNRPKCRKSKAIYNIGTVFFVCVILFVLIVTISDYITDSSITSGIFKKKKGKSCRQHVITLFILEGTHQQCTEEIDVDTPKKENLIAVICH